MPRPLTESNLADEVQQIVEASEPVGLAVQHTAEPEVPAHASAIEQLEEQTAEDVAAEEPPATSADEHQESDKLAAEPEAVQELAVNPSDADQSTVETPDGNEASPAGVSMQQTCEALNTSARAEPVALTAVLIIETASDAQALPIALAELAGLASTMVVVEADQTVLDGRSKPLHALSSLPEGVLGVQASLAVTDTEVRALAAKAEPSEEPEGEQYATLAHAARWTKLWSAATQHVPVRGAVLLAKASEVVKAAALQAVVACKFDLPVAFTLHHYRYSFKWQAREPWHRPGMWPAAAAHEHEGGLSDLRLRHGGLEEDPASFRAVRALLALSGAPAPVEFGTHISSAGWKLAHFGSQHAQLQTIQESVLDSQLARLENYTAEIFEAIRAGQPVFDIDQGVQVRAKMEWELQDLPSALHAAHGQHHLWALQ